MDNVQISTSVGEDKEAKSIEVVPLRGNLAQLLGSEVAAFYEKAGLCCDD